MIDFLGWTLVHAAWQGGVIATALAIALWLWRRRSASTRYVMAVGALGLMIVAPAATTALLDRRAADERVVGSRAGAAPISSGVATIVAPDVQNKGRASSESFVNHISGQIDGFLSWLVTGWLICTTLLSLRVIAAVANVRRLGRHGVSAADAHVLAMAEHIASRLGVRATVSVMQSAHIDVPMVVGWLKPVVLMPASLITGIAPAQLAMLLAHEFAHIRRYDVIVNFAQTVIETLLFYHPAAWWISARVRDERENCCDDMAIAISGTNRHEYGSMLLLLEESRTTPALAAAATGGSLLRRIRRLVLGPPRGVELGATWFMGVATMFMVLVVASSGYAPAAQIAPAVQPVSERAPMLRPTLIAGAAAASIAAARVTPQVPDFSGRWVAIDEASTSGSGAIESFTIRQRAQTLSITTDDANDKASVDFRIESADNRTVTVKGPVALRIRGFEVSVDSAIHAHISGSWGNVSLNLGEQSARIQNLVLATWTLSLDRDRNLVIETMYPATRDRPAKRALQRFRKG